MRHRLDISYPAYRVIQEKRRPYQQERQKKPPTGPRIPRLFLAVFHAS